MVQRAGAPTPGPWLRSPVAGTVDAPVVGVYPVGDPHRRPLAVVQGADAATVEANARLVQAAPALLAAAEALLGYAPALILLDPDATERLAAAVALARAVPV